MLKFFLFSIFSFFSFQTVFAQNIPLKSDKNCSTHERFENVFFKRKTLIQPYEEMRSLSTSELSSILKKFDKSIIKIILTRLGLDHKMNSHTSYVSVFKDYIDDLTVDTLIHLKYPELKLIRFNVGIGGGNGAYLIFNQLGDRSQISAELVSLTIDSDLHFCHEKFWQ